MNAKSAKARMRVALKLLGEYHAKANRRRLDAKRVDVRERAAGAAVAYLSACRYLRWIQRALERGDDVETK